MSAGGHHLGAATTTGMSLAPRSSIPLPSGNTPVVLHGASAQAAPMLRMSPSTGNAMMGSGGSPGPIGRPAGRHNTLGVGTHYNMHQMHAPPHHFQQLQHQHNPMGVMHHALPLHGIHGSQLVVMQNQMPVVQHLAPHPATMAFAMQHRGADIGQASIMSSLSSASSAGAAGAAVVPMGDIKRSGDSDVSIVHIHPRMATHTHIIIAVAVSIVEFLVRRTWCCVQISHVRFFQHHTFASSRHSHVVTPFTRVAH